MKTVLLPSGERVPALGLGTWRLGESSATRAREVDAVRTALDLGFRLIDTAEMYGEGGAEEVVGEAITGRRDEVFLVSKVYPHNASRKGVVAACERSLQRLGTDRLDLYLLHWRGSHPLAETIEGFERLRHAGKVRHWGVSNFDVDDMEELWKASHGEACSANQVYYSASRRGIEFDLMPWQHARKIPFMAYCPVDQGALARDKTFAAIGARYGLTAAQAALAWVLRRPDVIAIPKAARREHLEQNIAAARARLSAQDLDEIDRHFAPPRRKQPLAMT